MKKWTKEISIDAPIEVVWKLLDGSLEDMQRIMPQVVENTLIKDTPDKIGSVYSQVYKEGKRTQRYDVTTLHYLNTPLKKELKVGFILANMFDITAEYQLVKLDENKTLFTYSTTNKPLKWFIKLILKLANSDKVVVQFTNRVKEVAEAEAKAVMV